MTIACGLPQGQAPPQGTDWDAQRRAMVEHQLRQRGIASERVLEAMQRVPRHRFVPEAVRSESYQDHPLPIGFSQTISQPYIVGFMTDALRLEPSHRVLEIGTGSGYQAAILGELVRRGVHDRDHPGPRRARPLGPRGARLPQHPRARRKRLSRLAGGGAVRPNHRHGGARRGAAGARRTARTGGLMAIPVGGAEQELRILRRTPTAMETLATLPVRFVPMTGKPK